MSNIRLETWSSLEVDRRYVRLVDGERYVQLWIEEEKLVCTNLQEYHKIVQGVLTDLCRQWNEKFGGRTLKPVPPDREGVEWTIVEDDIIDGELVVNIIERAPGEERRAIGA